MKHIKIAAYAVKPKLNTVNVTILEQTHIGINFGFCDRDFRASNGFILSSSMVPQALNETKTYVRGAQASSNNNSIVMSSACFARFAVAVEEYNKVFAAPPVPKAPAFGPCTVIIG